MLIKIAPCFMRAISSAPMRPPLRGEKTMCTEMTSASLIEIRFADEDGAGRLGLRLGQVRAPGDDLHVERERRAGQTPPEAASTHNAEGFAGEAYAGGHARVETAGAHGLIGGGIARAAAIIRPSASSAVA